MSNDDGLGQLGPIEIPPAYEVVVRHLRRGIHLGEFPPGAKLPRERDLAEHLGVSRATLREALRQLKGEGYVEIRRGPRGGVFVRGDRASRDALRRWLDDQGTDMAGVFDFRTMVESLAARRAAARADDALVDRLNGLNARMKEAAEIGAFRLADLRFHMAIAEAADARLVRTAVEEARAALFVPFQLLGFEDMRARSVPEHAKIIDGIRSGDGDRAAAEMAAHVRATATALAPADPSEPAVPSEPAEPAGPAGRDNSRTR
jgi:GntR family transcriptional regulator, transcriptional repressor for pyruvate dehydrogenase complex